MKLKYILIVFLFIVLKSNSQENQKVLFTIDGEPYYTQEFLTVYKKNLQIVEGSKTTVEDYLKLFIDYKLKVKEAKSLGLDTLLKFKNELKQYKNTLVLPYLKDKEVTKKLVSEAYDRLKKEVSVSHILLFLKPDATSKDTLDAYNKLTEARNLILDGNDFNEVAKKYSEDPTVQQNGGELGYFTALQMVYPFENVAYNTPVNEISKPFRTKFGYHILKVNDSRDSKGEVEVAHIMLKNEGESTKKKIDSIYDIVSANTDNFAEIATKISDDKASAINGGKLKKFGTGQMVEEFADVAFSLKNEGEISKPFKTRFGWHIVKLIKKDPLESLDKIESQLTQQIESDERSNLIGKSIINKLFKEYQIIDNEEAINQFEVDNWKETPEKFQKIILSINEKEILQNKFITFLNTVKNTPLLVAYENFKENQVLEYYKDNIEKFNPEFGLIYNDFKEGMLLFDLLEKQVWDKSKDSVALLNYFNLNKNKKYKTKKFEAIKGIVISDFQNETEEMLIKNLHDKYNVVIDKSEKNNILKLIF